LEETKETLDPLGLTFEVLDSSEFYPNLPPMSVISFYPNTGHKVKKGRTINISLNPSGPRMIKIPDVIEKSRRRAIYDLESKGFRLGKLSYVPYIGKDMVVGMQVNDLLVTNEGINHIPEYIVDEGDRIVRKAYRGAGDPPALRIVKGTTGKVLKVGKVKPTFYEKVEIKNMELVSVYVNAGMYGEHQIVTVELNDAKKSIVDFIVPVRAAPGKVQGTYLLTPDIAFGYVNNVHKAQGHTYSTAYVDYDNIHNNFKAAWNGDAESFLKAIYVAVSRPRQKLVMRMSGESVYPKGLLDLNNIQKCQG
jgi:hypothetical protein